jgi:hypothetical protein
MGTTSLDLFRSGNTTTARLDRVRINGPNSDVDTYVDTGTGATWVQANGKGISTQDAVDPSWTGTPWRLPAGAAYPSHLLLWNDNPGHWLWAPEHDMPLTTYEDALRVVNALFVKV